MYLIGYLDKVIKPLVFILAKMSRYVKTFNIKDDIGDDYIGDEIKKYGDKVYNNSRGLNMPEDGAE